MKRKFRFNTSHVVVYPVPYAHNNAMLNAFQYISCCSLSLIDEYHRLEKVCFNTSHVVVYLEKDRRNISVYTVSIHLMLQFILFSFFVSTPKLLFQYISCCSLSALLFAAEGPFFRFNTSHVVVYPTPAAASFHQSDSFNTSHVVVYQFCNRSFIPGTGVSIHLMLQFILVGLYCGCS